MFSKCTEKEKKRILIILGFCLGILVISLAVTLKFGRDSQTLKLTRIKLDGESRDKGEYTFIWNSAGSEATYKLLRYSSVKGKYVTWKTVTDAGENDTVELTTAREYGKYKLKTEMKVGDTNISYSSENTLKLKSKLKKAKKYSKIHIIKTIKKKDVELVANAKGKGKVTHAQSMCSTGNGYIVVLVDRGNTTGRLEKFDRDGNLIKARKTSYVGHANGCTYNPNNKSVYVMRTYAGRRNKTISVFSAKTLKAKKSTSLSVAPSAIAYDKQMEQYYFTASNRIYKMNSKMKSRKTYHRLRWHRSQDVCGYNGVIMSCIWTGGKNSFIDMYRSTDGAYIGSYSIPLGEIESVCIDDGHLVMLYNGGNIYRTKTRLSISKLF